MAQEGLWEDQSSSISGDLLIQSTLGPEQDDLLHILLLLVRLHAQEDLHSLAMSGLDVLVLPGGGDEAPSHLTAQAWSAHPVVLAHKAWLLDPGAAHASQGHHPVLLGELDVGLQHPLRAGFFRAAL